jgi:hypothetical protein
MPRPRSATIVQHERDRLQPAGVSCVLQVGSHAPQILCRMLLARDLDWRCHFPAPRIRFPVQESTTDVRSCESAHEPFFMRIGIIGVNLWRLWFRQTRRRHNMELYPGPPGERGDGGTAIAT